MIVNQVQSACSTLLSHLMCKLVANHHSNPDLIRNAGCVRINKKAGLPVSGQTPVFHGAALEVRNGDQICDKQEEEEKGAVYQDKNGIKQYLALVEDRGCQSIFDKNPSF